MTDATRIKGSSRAAGKTPELRKSGRRDEGESSNYEPPSRIRNPERRAEVRAQIIDAALDIIARKGFHESSVEEIADAAGLTIPSLYKYVRSKHDILFLVTNERSALMVENFRAAAANTADPKERLTAVVRQICVDMDAFAKTVRVNYRESHTLEPQALAHLRAGTDKFRAELFQVLLEVSPAVTPDDKRLVRTIADNVWLLAQMWAVQHGVYAGYLDLQQFIEVQTELLFRQLRIA